MIDVWIANKEKNRLSQKKEKESNNNKVQLLFDDTVITVIGKELVKQQLHIEDGLEKLKTELESNRWKELYKNNTCCCIIFACSFIGQNQIGARVQLKYNESHLNKDVLAKFGAQSA